MTAPPRDGRSSSPGAVVLGLLLLSAAVRVGYLLALEVPAFDPWRHLQLVSNLRTGQGFTLFADQPYLWYQPLWHRLAAAIAPGAGMAWLAGLFSCLAAPLVYLAGPREVPGAARGGAIAAGVLTAVSGPVVAFTCHYGSEAAALALALTALAICSRSRRPAPDLAAGLLLGLATCLRPNFALWIIPLAWIAPRRARRLALGVGMALPLVVAWWRNHGILVANPWVFTWDGLAVRSSGFNPVSTLLPQLHPELREALQRLHEIIVPQPEWTLSPERVLFLVAGLLALLLARRLELLLGGAAYLAYFLTLDRSLSSHFFRLYLPLFPLLFLAAGWTVQRISPGRGRRAAAWGLVALIGISGAPYLSPGPMVPLSMVTPPVGLLAEDAYLVNSGFYHPASLIYRHPEIDFVGLPLRPDEFDAFHEAFPGYTRVLWHDFSVQDEIARHLEARGWRIEAAAENLHGRRYTVLRAPAAE